MKTITLQVRVKPRAKTASFEKLQDGSWVAKLRSPPIDGKANEELVALVAEHFHCRRAEVVIKAGASGRMKLIQIHSS